VIHTDKKRPVKEALEMLTDEWIEDGHFCDQTIMDLRDTLIEQLATNDVLKNKITQLNKAGYFAVSMCVLIGTLILLFAIF